MSAVNFPSANWSASAVAVGKCMAGRSMLENVMRIDAIMHAMSIAGFENAATIFRDFKAAFPSFAHNYLFKILQSIGLPRVVIIIVQKL